MINELGDSIQFCEPHQKNESQFIFSSKVNVRYLIKLLRSQNIIKEAAQKFRRSLFDITLNWKIDFVIHTN